MAYDEFSLTVRDSCHASEPSLVAGVDDATYKVDSTSVGVDYTPDFDPDVNTCPYTLTIWAKLATQPDSDYEATGSGSNYDWIENSSGYTATVTQTDHTAYADPIVYTVWWHYVLTSPVTSEITGSADDYMELTVVDLCWDNVPSVTQETSDILFTIASDTAGASAVDGTANLASTTVTDCTITKTLEIFDETSNTWVRYTSSNAASYPWIDSQSDADGEIGILDTNTSGDYDDVLETVFQLRWKNTDLRSKADGATVYDYFDVTIKWECHLNTITIGNSLEGIEDWSYELDDSADTKAASYTELYPDCPTAVDITCEAQNDDDNWTAVGSEVTVCNLGTGFTI